MATVRIMVSLPKDLAEVTLGLVNTLGISQSSAVCSVMRVGKDAVGKLLANGGDHKLNAKPVAPTPPIKQKPFVAQTKVIHDDLDDEALAAELAEDYPDIE